MAQAPRDQNRVPTLLCTSTDGITPVAIKASPITHMLETHVNATPYTAKAIAKRDENRVPTLLCVSSADGTTPVAVYADPTDQEIFIKYI